MKVNSVAKFIVAAVAAGVSVLVPAIGGDSILDTTEMVQIGIAVLTALGVYVVPNGNKADHRL